MVWNVPPGATTVPEGWEPSEASEGTNDYDKVGYGGSMEGEIVEQTQVTGTHPA